MGVVRGGGWGRGRGGDVCAYKIPRGCNVCAFELPPSLFFFACTSQVPPLSPRLGGRPRHEPPLSLSLPLITADRALTTAVDPPLWNTVLVPVLLCPSPTACCTYRPMRRRIHLCHMRRRIHTYVLYLPTDIHSLFFNTPPVFIHLSLSSLSLSRARALSLSPSLSLSLSLCPCRESARHPDGMPFLKTLSIWSVRPGDGRVLKWAWPPSPALQSTSQRHRQRHSLLHIRQRLQAVHSVSDHLLPPTPSSTSVSASAASFFSSSLHPPCTFPSYPSSLHKGSGCCSRRTCWLWRKHPWRDSAKNVGPHFAVVETAARLSRPKKCQKGPPMGEKETYCAHF